MPRPPCSGGSTLRRALGAVLLVAAALPFGASAQAADDGERKALRVCEDPNNLPYSNAKGEGYEDAIAQLFADELGLPLKAFFFPQRMAFIRNTLRMKVPGEDFPCDLVMSVPKGFDQVSATQPYYRSTYVLVFPASGKLGTVSSVDEFLAL